MNKIIFDAAHPVKMTEAARRFEGDEQAMKGLKTAIEIAKLINGKVIRNATDDGFIIRSRVGWLVKGYMKCHQDECSAKWSVVAGRLRKEESCDVLLFTERERAETIAESLGVPSVMVPIEEVLADGHPVWTEWKDDDDKRNFRGWLKPYKGECWFDAVGSGCVKVRQVS